MAFTPAQKRAHRAKPEVQQRERAYKANWDTTNKYERAAYQRAWRARQRPTGSITEPVPMDTTTAPLTSTSRHDSAAKQMDLFDADSV
jgi:hypothetical protein